MTISVREVRAEETRLLRQALLRPDFSIEELNYPGDEEESTLHFGAFFDEEMVGIASVYLQPPRRSSMEKAWRLRAMGVNPSLRRRGVGSRLMEAAFGHVRSAGGVLLWCDARLVALEFYAAHGMRIVGEEYEVPGVGPHRTMIIDL